jgi:subtilisin family serine protease
VIIRTLLAFFALSAVASAEAFPQLIARVAPGTSGSGLAARYDVTFRDFAPGRQFLLFELTPGQAPDTVKAAMMTDPKVIWVEDNAEMGSTGPGGSKGSTQPVLGPRALHLKNPNYRIRNAAALTQIGWNKAEANATGRTVRIAVLDTGLGQAQTQLWDATADSYNAVEFGETAFDAPRGTDSDENGTVDQATGHGTMVAGLINMVAPKARLIIVRVADSDGMGSSWTLTKGIAFAANQGAEVANLSMGSPTRIPAVSDVLDWATEEMGMLVVASIGNNGKRTALSPSDISKVLCVAGVDADNRKAWFSNWRGTADACAPSIDLLAPWWSGGSCRWEGTSLAAPLVAGCLADALRKTTPQLPGDLIDEVNRTGTDIDALNPNFRHEIGTLLNHTALVKALK